MEENVERKMEKVEGQTEEDNKERRKRRWKRKRRSEDGRNDEDTKGGMIWGSRGGQERMKVGQSMEGKKKRREKEGKNVGEKKMEKRRGRRNRGRRGWKQRRPICDIYCFSNWKGKLVLFCSGAHSVEKQEARRPAHPHGQLVPSDSCSPLPVSYIQWFPPWSRPPGNQPHWPLSA